MARASSTGRVRNGECPPLISTAIDTQPIPGCGPDPCRVDRPVVTADDRARLDVRPGRERRRLVHDPVGLGSESLGRPARDGGRGIGKEQLRRRLRTDHPDVLADIDPFGGRRGDAPVDRLGAALLVGALTGRGEVRGQEDQAPDRSVRGDQRDDQAGHRVADQDRLAARFEGALDGPGVLRGPERRIGDREVHHDHPVTEALQLRSQEIPTPCPVIGTVHECDVHRPTYRLGVVLYPPALARGRTIAVPNPRERRRCAGRSGQAAAAVTIGTWLER